MADAKEVLKDLELDDEVKAKIIEKFNPLLKDYESQIADANGKLEDAISTRQKVKDKNKELETQIASGNTQAQELLEAKTKEIESLTKSIEDIIQERDSIKTKYSAVETARRNEIIEQLPDGELREVFKDSKDDLEQLKAKVDAILKTVQTKPGANGGRGGKISIDGKKFEDFTPTELIKMEKEQPDSYLILKTDYMKRNNTR